MSISSNDPKKPTLNVKLSGNVKSSAPPPSPPPSGEFKYQGTLYGTWFLTGVCNFPEGYTSSISESGQFSITIDVYGNMTSTGFYGGWPISGTVNVDGDYNWTVSVNAAGTTVSLSGQGHVTLSGNSLSATGSWSGTVASTAASCSFNGGWSLTGTTSY